MSRIAEAVQERLIENQIDAQRGSEEERITANVGQVDNYRLDRIAERLEMSKAAAAGWLLGLAIDDAAEELRVGPGFLTDQEFLADFKAWREGRRSSRLKAVGE